jgi:WD40 repeat protein
MNKITFCVFLIVSLFGLISCQENTSSQKSEYRLETKLMRSGKIWSLDISPDGRYVACGNASGLLRIYDTQTLRLLHILTGFNSTINSIHWNPEGKKIIASGAHEDPRVMLWDFTNESRIIIDDHKRQVRSVKWSPKGTHFASSSHDGTIRIWTPEGKFVTLFKGANGGCVGIDWLNEDTLAASCWDNTIRTYTISRSDSLLIENGTHRRKAVLSVDWHPNGELLATGDYGNNEDTIHAVKIWTKKGTLKATMQSHQKEVRSLSWNKEGTILASGGKTVRLWNAEGELIKVFEKNESPVWSLDWNMNGSQIVSGHNDGKIRIWNTKGKLLNLLNGHSSETTAIAFNKDSTSLCVGFSDGTLRSFNLNNLTSTSIQAHSRSITHISWSNNENHVAISSNDGTCSIWSIKNKLLSSRVGYFGNELYAQSMAWNEDDSAVAYLHDDSKVSVFSPSGVFKYSTDIDGGKFNALAWKKGKPYGIVSKEKVFVYNSKIRLRRNNVDLELIPLNNNRFALIDTIQNKIVHGSQDDFIRLTEHKEGFTKIKTWE